MNILEIVGGITVGVGCGLMAALTLRTVYRSVRAVVLATDFTRWYWAQSRKYDASYRMKTPVRGYLHMIAEMYHYDVDVVRMHKNGARYQPFARV